jgi:hypothetical protein
MENGEPSPGAQGAAQLFIAIRAIFLTSVAMILASSYRPMRPKPLIAKMMDMSFLYPYGSRGAAGSSLPVSFRIYVNAEAFGPSTILSK